MRGCRTFKKKKFFFKEKNKKERRSRLLRLSQNQFGKKFIFKINPTFNLNVI